MIQSFHLNPPDQRSYFYIKMFQPGNTFNTYNFFLNQVTTIVFILYSYLALEDVVGNISMYLKQVGSDPVLNFENFKQMVYQEMHFQNFKSFR